MLKTSSVSEGTSSKEVRNGKKGMKKQEKKERKL
jgi:hypothetical protein